MSADPYRVPPALHELESEIMQLIWGLGECSVRVILGELNGRSDKKRKYTTVMTTMMRLDKKGLLERRREGRSDLYKPLLTQAQYRQARAQAEVGALVEHYGEAALANFVRELDQLDPERREQLRRLARRDKS